MTKDSAIFRRMWLTSILVATLALAKADVVQTYPLEAEISP
jgi:hypothetical protein